ncbi:MAG: hypothetical protein ACXW4B_00205 [Micavibrio sp.]
MNPDKEEPVEQPDDDILLAAEEGEGDEESGDGKGGGGGKAPKAKTDDKTALDIAFSDDVLGLEEATEPKEAETEFQQDVSAYDSDEITDPEIEDIDPLMMILGGQEKPWENEKLSVIERMMMDPGYERDLDALDRADPKAKGLGIKGVALAAGVVALAAGVAAEANAKGPGVAGVARGPQRAAEQDQTQIKAEAKKPGAADRSEPITVQARRNAEEVTLRQIGTGLAATVGMKADAADFDKSKASVERSDGGDAMQDLIEIQQQLEQNSPDSDISWTPNAGPEQRFDQAMDMIYASLGVQTLMNVSPYRQAGWDEKRLEQKENSQDVTIAPQAPEPKTPAPDLTYQRDYQINLGPGGM